MVVKKGCLSRIYGASNPVVRTGFHVKYYLDYLGILWYAIVIRHINKN